MKKFVSLLLMFSILVLSVPLKAKERKGAELIVQRTDGTVVMGELIAVKENSLLLMERDSGADVTVDVEDIGVIRIVRKSQLLLGAGLGTLAGVGTFSVLIKDAGTETWAGIVAVIAAVGTLLIGVIIGAVAGTDKKFQFEGKAEVKIQSYLEKLRKKARIRNSQ